MRGFDFAPLYRATVGYDRIADMMDRVLTNDVSQPTYPPYNIEKTDENAYRISVAVAGFTAEELSVEVKENTLVIAARKAEDDSGRTYLHRG
ncbi:Hsp20 family protein, partial [Thioclava sp. BHET1]